MGGQGRSFRERQRTQDPPHLWGDGYIQEVCPRGGVRTQYQGNFEQES